jgi:hypothetical protein
MFRRLEIGYNSFMPGHWNRPELRGDDFGPIDSWRGRVDDGKSGRVAKTMSLEEFLRLPQIDEHPYLEYIDGRIEAKVSPQKKHGLLGAKRLMMR